MAQSFGTAGDAQISTGIVGCHWLVEMDFSTGTQYFTTAPVNVTSGSATYVGVGNILEISPLNESEDNSTSKLTISVSVSNSAIFAAVLGPSSTYRGRAVRLYLQLFDRNFAVVGSKVQRWTGTMEPVKISRTAAADGPSTGRIEMPCSRNGMARARNYAGARLTHAQQLSRYAGDMGLQYMQALIEEPTLWLSKSFLRQ